jgi:hypothetical protein
VPDEKDKEKAPAVPPGAAASRALPETRLVDTKSRMTLFRDFAGAQVTIERISPEEIRVC